MVYVLQVVHGDAGGVFDVGCEVHVPVKDDTNVSSCVATRNDMAINQDAVNGVVTMLTLGEVLEKYLSEFVVDENAS